ncbi:DUF3696 domain-containing protein [Planctomycetota bacterium]
MITKINIENFKGIGEKIVIPIRPLTLFFGANSAGKSTILHAFHYVREILERQNYDADQTLSGGEFIELGGFGDFVHKKEMDRSVIIRIDFDLTRENLTDYLTDDLYLNNMEVRFEEDSFELGSIYYQFDDLKQCWLELEVSYSKLMKRPYLSRYSTGINDKKIADITYKAGDKHATIYNIDLNHPIFDIFADYDRGKGISINLATSAYTRCGETALPEDISSLTVQFETNMEYGAMPNFDGTFSLPSLLPEKPQNNDDSSSGAEHDEAWNYRLKDDRFIAGMTLTALLKQYIVGPGEYARNYLNQLCYIGPLRVVPSKDYKRPSHLADSFWATGLAAWDILKTPGNEELVQKVSDWLSDTDKLDTGYLLSSNDYQEIDLQLKKSMLQAEYDDDPAIQETLERVPITRRIYLHDIQKDTKVSPMNIGVGISQVIPVIAAIFAKETSLIQIEQPALHLHPTQQAAVGDLVIAGTKQQGKQLLIETHSEHLILRLLRRIRETSRAKLDDDLLAISPNDIQVSYIQSKEGQTSIKIIDIDKDGEFVQPWPDDFFDQDFHERFE